MNELWEDLLQDAVLDSLSVWLVLHRDKENFISHELLHKIREFLFKQGKDLRSNIMCGLFSKGETWCGIVLRNMYLQSDVKRHTAEVQAEVQQWARPYIPHSSLWLALPQMFRAKILLFETGSNLPQCQDELQTHESVYFMASNALYMSSKLCEIMHGEI